MIRGFITWAGVALCAGALSFGGTPRSRALSRSQQRAFTVVWSKQQARLPLYSGEGAALSPDGKAVAYIGAAGLHETEAALFLADVETDKQAILLGPDRVPSLSPEIADHPSFSPDGKSIILTLRGPTWHYPSDICVLGLEGKNLTKVTQSLPFTNKPPEAANGASYQRYYYRASYSPNGSRILLHIHDAVQEKEFAALMDAKGGHLEILAEGRPCCWSGDGKSVYYIEKGNLIRMDLETHTTQTLAPPQEGIGPVGRMADREWLAFKLDDGRIGWYNVETGKPIFRGLSAVPPAETVGQEKLDLKGFDWSRSGKVLLWYQGDYTERFEVVRFTDASSISQ